MESMRSSAASLNEESVLALVKPFFGTSQWRHLILYVHFVAGYPKKTLKGSLNQVFLSPKRTNLPGELVAGKKADDVKTAA